MTLTEREMEVIRENQADLNLTDEEVEMVDRRRALFNPLANEKGEPCEACGDPDCIKATAIIDEGHNIHAEDHPEMVNERARENRRAW